MWRDATSRACYLGASNGSFEEVRWKREKGQKDMLACVDVEIDTSEVCFIDQGLVPPGELPPYVKAWKYVATSPQIRLDTLCS